MNTEILLDTLSSSPAVPTPDLLLEELREIKLLLAAQSAAVLNRAAAARFIGVSPATLDRLASANPALRPVRVSQGRVVWRREDLQAFLDGLEQ
jgi:predicted DNA-binding transcriptional regulator AlpA